MAFPWFKKKDACDEKTKIVNSEKKSAAKAMDKVEDEIAALQRNMQQLLVQAAATDMEYEAENERIAEEKKQGHTKSSTTPKNDQLKAQKQRQKTKSKAMQKAAQKGLDKQIAKSTTPQFENAISEVLDYGIETENFAQKNMITGIAGLHSPNPFRRISSAKIVKAAKAAQKAGKSAENAGLEAGAQFIDAEKLGEKSLGQAKKVGQQAKQLEKGYNAVMVANGQIEEDEDTENSTNSSLQNVGRTTVKTKVKTNNSDSAQNNTSSNRNNTSNTNSAISFGNNSNSASKNKIAENNIDNKTKTLTLNEINEQYNNKNLSITSQKIEEKKESAPSAQKEIEKKEKVDKLSGDTTENKEQQKLLIKSETAKKEKKKEEKGISSAQNDGSDESIKAQFSIDEILKRKIRRGIQTENA